MSRIQSYIDKIISTADLSKGDSTRVRKELETHIFELLEASQSLNIKESELVTMLEKKFGEPEELGKEISKAKGRFLTYLKKESRKFLFQLPIIIVIVILLKMLLINAYVIRTDAVADVAPKNSRIIINKLSSNFKSGDLVAYELKRGEVARVGIIESYDATNNQYVIRRKNETNVTVNASKIVGKAFFIYGVL